MGSQFKELLNVENQTYRLEQMEPVDGAEDICRSDVKKAIQEAQLPQRNSASAAHVYLGWLTDRAMHRDICTDSKSSLRLLAPLRTPSSLYK